VELAILDFDQIVAFIVYKVHFYLENDNQVSYKLFLLVRFQDYDEHDK